MESKWTKVNRDRLRENIALIRSAIGRGFYIDEIYELLNLCDSLEAKLSIATVALKEIDWQDCESPKPGPDGEQWCCRQREPQDKELWCVVCMASAALKDMKQVTS